jgi:hypothetical protein
MISVRATLEQNRVKILEPEKIAEWSKSLPAGIALEVTFRKWEDGRSLRANALFHELVGRYSKALGMAFDQVKTDFKKHYGIWVTAEEALKDQPAWSGRFIEYYGELLYFKTTAEYTVKEFNELTKGALAECYDNGVKIDDIMKESEKWR